MLCHVQGNRAVTGWVGKEAFLPWCQTLTAYACGAPEDQDHGFHGKAFWKSKMEAMKGIAILPLILEF